LAEKIKFIITGLAGILAISILINLQTYLAKKTIELERNALRAQNESLTQKIEEVLQEKKQLQEKINTLNSDLEKVSQEKEKLNKEKEGLNKQYEAIVKERDALMEKLKTQTQEKITGLPATQDEVYWAGILKDLNRQKQDLEQKLSDQQSLLDAVALELAKATQGLKPLKDENEVLALQLKAVSKRKDKLEDELQKAHRDKADLENKLIEMQGALNDKVTQIAVLNKQLETFGMKGETTITPSRREAVELPPIVVRPQAEVSSFSLQTPLWQEKGKQVLLGGSILGINKENNFVVIDLGRNSGIKIGDTFSVYRDDKPIATIEVIQVRESVAACNINAETTPIEVGDSIR
jgi:predicted  nucleic acid-binding Zn-ribbon protein